MFATHPPIAERVRELDPSIRRENLQALTAAAGDAAEKLRLAPLFTEMTDAPPTSQLNAPAETSTAPRRVTSLAGTFDETQQRYAHHARESIPEQLHEFADSPDAARVLMFALLRGSDPQVAARQDAVIRKVYGEQLLARIHEAVPVANSLPPALRLPAVQQLLPALRHMTRVERTELRAAAEQVAIADQNIDVFECCLTLLLESALRDELERNDEHGSGSLTRSVQPVASLFAVLAEQGADDPSVAQRAYEAGIRQVFPHQAPAFSRVERWPEALRASLQELARLRPFAKKVLIEGLVRTVAHDRRLSVAEGELLRTVCAVLHCPLPPILSAGG